ncbi:MAG: hypothetical protein B6D58_09545 [candidate division Zixibacteria bacterium 4484_95]|nr:MAG: hypothetical protein B6D58_09545 [candidate division Zixibacteria bacterium 4484_95]
MKDFIIGALFGSLIGWGIISVLDNKRFYPVPPPINIAFRNDNHVNNNLQNLSLIFEDFDNGFSYTFQAFVHDGEVDNSRWACSNGYLTVDNSDNMLSYFLLTSKSWRTLIADVDFKITHSYGNGRVGFIIGHNDIFIRFRVCFESQTADFYCITITPLTFTKLNQVSLIKPLAIDTWYRLRLVINNGFQFFLDDQLLLTIPDYINICIEFEPEGDCVSISDYIMNSFIGLYAVECSAQFDNLYVKSLEIYQHYGKNALAQELSHLEWRYQYVKNFFDCSNMSAALAQYLQSLGWKTLIACGKMHAWVLVETHPGLYTAVEATCLAIKSDFPQPEEIYSVDQIMKLYPREYRFDHLPPPILVRR